MSEALYQSVRTSLSQIPSSAQVLVGYSGGLDSTVLLNLLVGLVAPNRITAVHVNHGLSPQADEWETFCRQQAMQLQLPFVAQKVSVKNLGQGIEEAARDQRYQVFEQYLPAGGALLLAHHQDDQQETLLLRLLRGAGPKGLGAMDQRRRFGEGWLVRPLLQASRRALEEYATEHQLSWIEDPSNQDTHFDRNYLRSKVLPLINRRWPGASQTMGRSAHLCRESDALLTDLAQLDMAQLGLRRERLGVSVLRAPLLQWRGARQANLLRYLCSQQGLAAPELGHWQQIQQQLLIDVLRPDTEAMVSWPGANLGYFKQRLYLLPELPQPIAQAITWSGQAPITLSNGGSLELLPGGDFHWDGNPLEVSPRVAGLRAQPLGRNHSQKLKKLLQENEIEPWLKNCVPLIFQQGQLQAVADYWVEACAQSNVPSGGMRVVWQPTGSRKI